MELIDRKALANEDPCEHCHYKKERCEYTCGEKGYAGHAIWRTIDDAPTIDAVPVVRCKDCSKRNSPFCMAFELKDGPQDDDYCSLGEKLDTD